MADLVYNKAKEELANDVLDWTNDTLKVMLVTSSYTVDPDHLVVDAGGSNDPVDHELNVTGYTRGWGGAGRKSITSKSVQVNNTLNRAELLGQVADWTGLGSGQSIAAALLIKEGGANDTTSRLIAYIDINPDFPTSLGTFPLTWASNIVLVLS